MNAATFQVDFAAVNTDQKVGGIGHGVKVSPLGTGGGSQTDHRKIFTSTTSTTGMPMIHSRGLRALS